MKWKDLLFRSVCLAIGGGSALLSGCATTQESSVKSVLIASSAKFPIRFDGELKDAAWVKTPGITLKKLPSSTPEPADSAERPESCAVKMLYDEQYLYLGCAMADSDVCNGSKADQLPLARYGDTLEITLAPENGSGCWQILAAPNGQKSSFFFRSGSMENIEPLKDAPALPELATRVALSGTLNNQNDTDNSWTMEIRIPRAALTIGKQNFAPGTAWKIRIARYNVGFRQSTVERTVYPLPETADNANRQWFAPIEFH